MRHDPLGGVSARSAGAALPRNHRRRSGCGAPEEEPPISAQVESGRTRRVEGLARDGAGRMGGEDGGGARRPLPATYRLPSGANAMSENPARRRRGDGGSRDGAPGPRQVPHAQDAQLRVRCPGWRPSPRVGLRVERDGAGGQPVSADEDALLPHPVERRWARIGAPARGRSTRTCAPEGSHRERRDGALQLREPARFRPRRSGATAACMVAQVHEASHRPSGVKLMEYEAAKPGSSRRRGLRAARERSRTSRTAVANHGPPGSKARACDVVGVGPGRLRTSGWASGGSRQVPRRSAVARSGRTRPRVLLAGRTARRLCRTSGPRRTRSGSRRTRPTRPDPRPPRTRRRRPPGPPLGKKVTPDTAPVGCRRAAGSRPVPRRATGRRTESSGGVDRSAVPSGSDVPSGETFPDDRGQGLGLPAPATTNS